MLDAPDELASVPAEDAAAAVRSLQFQLKAARSEISKLHRQMNALTRTVKQELTAVRREALGAAAAQGVERPLEGAPSISSAVPPPGTFNMAPIGHIESCFVYRRAHLISRVVAVHSA